MKIAKSSYVISSPSLAQSPYHDLREFAFIGRSNVGKSSLINAVVNHSGLAKTSSTPGKTRLINFFKIGSDKGEFMVVDLPGYGYAKISKNVRQKWVDTSSEYLSGRKQLTHLFILLDFRHNPQIIDIDFLDWVIESKIPYTLVLTKADKLNQKERSKQTNKFRDFGVNTGLSNDIIVTSAENKEGIDLIQAVITDLLK
jgi:GTP-binding protein